MGRGSGIPEPVREAIGSRRRPVLLDPMPCRAVAHRGIRLRLRQRMVSLRLPGVEGPAGQVGAPIGLTRHVNRYAPISLLKPWVFREPRPTNHPSPPTCHLSRLFFTFDCRATLFIITLPHRFVRTGCRINPPDYENTCSAQLGNPARFAHKKRKACTQRNQAFFANSWRHGGAVCTDPSLGR